MKEGMGEQESPRKGKKEREKKSTEYSSCMQRVSKQENSRLADADKVAAAVGTGEALLRCTQSSSSTHREPLSQAGEDPDTGHTDCPLTPKQRC